MIAAGVTGGLAGAMALTRLIAPQLWGVTPTDPLTYAGALTLVVVAAILAGLAPARRAMMGNPAIVLRSD